MEQFIYAAPFILLLAWYIFNRYVYQPIVERNRRKAVIVISTKRKAPWPVVLERFLQQAYVVGLRIPGVRQTIRKVRLRVETTGATEGEYELRQAVMTIVGIVFIVVFLFCLIVLIVLKTLWAIIWALVLLFIVQGIVIDVFVHRLEYNLLTAIKQMNDKLRLSFQKSKNVHDTLFEVIQMCDKTVKRQLQMIFDIVTDMEADRKLREYEAIAPTRHLINIAGMSLVTLEQGDIVTSKGSAYLSALTSINQQVTQDIYQRSKLWYRMKGFETISVIPIFVIEPLKIFATSNFPALQNFYDGQLGLLLQFICYGLAISSYFIIRRMKDFYQPKAQSLATKQKWEQRLIRRIPLLERLLLRLVPKEHEREYIRVKKLLKEANSFLRIEWLYLHRVLLAALTFVIAISAFAYSEMSVEHRVKYKPTYASMAMKPNERQRIAAEEATVFDRRLLRIMEKEHVHSPGAVRQLVLTELQQSPHPFTDRDVTVITARLIEKDEALANAYFKWWEFLLSLMMAWGGYQFPILLLFIQREMTQQAMDNEVFDFMTIISVLREFPTISTAQILTWMERTSVIFKPIIRRILDEFDSGQYESLERAKQLTNFESFLNVLERLKLSLVNISIAEAFDDIEVERQYYLEKKIELNERSLQEKVIYGDMLAMAPIMTVTILLFVFPLFYVAYMQISGVSTQFL